MQVKSSCFIPNPRIPYHEVMDRLRRLRWGRLTQLGLVSGYPFFVWHYSSARPVKTTVLSAGIHGDEPSGVECVLGLLERRPVWLKNFDLTVFPCLNPWGYEHNRRTNEDGCDVNRQWRSRDSLEVLQAQRVLGDRRFDLAICLHEDYDATGFYVYELIRNGNCFGPAMARAVSRLLPIEPRKWIEGRRARHGVVTRPMESIRRRKHWPEAVCYFMRHTDHTLTTETPTRLPLEKRVRAHTEAVRVALKLLASSCRV